MTSFVGSHWSPPIRTMEISDVPFTGTGSIILLCKLRSSGRRRRQENFARPSRVRNSGRRRSKGREESRGVWGRGGSGWGWRWEPWRYWWERPGGTGSTRRRRSGRSGSWRSGWGCGPSRCTWWPTPSPLRFASPTPSSSRPALPSSSVSSPPSSASFPPKSSAPPYPSGSDGLSSSPLCFILSLPSLSWSVIWLVSEMKGRSWSTDAWRSLNLFLWFDATDKKRMKLPCSVTKLTILLVCNRPLLYWNYKGLVGHYACTTHREKLPPHCRIFNLFFAEQEGTKVT